MIRKNENGIDYSNKLLKVLAGIFIGFLVGTVTMLFLAPKSGKDTMADIMSKGADLRDQTNDRMEDTMTHVLSKVNQFAQDSRGMIHDFRPNDREFILEQFGHKLETEKGEN